MENEIIYKQVFLDLVDKELSSNKNDAEKYIGTGNPNAKILFVGKERSYSDVQGYAQWWKNIITQKQESPFPYHKVHIPKKAGHTWRKYQSLYEYIYPEHTDKHFENVIFTTEVNINSSAQTHNAKKDGMSQRKETFFHSNFIQEFSVVVLACGWDYITPKECYEIFKVNWKDNNPSKKINASNSFYTHYNEDKSKLVIHTRQLSGSVSNELLEEMGKVIREFLIANNWLEL